MSYLCYLCSYEYSSVQHTLCCVFVFLGLVYPMLPVSLESPFLIAPSVFSNVYFRGNCIYLYDIHTLVSIIHFRQYFSYNVTVSFIVEETRVHGENHRPVASHWQIRSHNVALSTPRLIDIRTHNVSGDRHWLHWLLYDYNITKLHINK